MLRRQAKREEVTVSIKHEQIGQANEFDELDRIVLGSAANFTSTVKLEVASDSSDDEGPAEEKIQRNSVEESVAERIRVKVEKKSAWSDDDDALELKECCSAEASKARKFGQITSYGHEQRDGPDGTRYSKRLRTHFEKSIGIPVPDWAKSANSKKRRKNFSDDESDDEFDLTQRTGNYIGKSVHLPQGTLQFKRVSDVTSSSRVKAVINSIEFHKQAQVLLVSGYTQTVMLFEINGKDNPLLHTIKFDGFPVETARFSADGQRVVVGSKMHSHFYYYDMHADTVVNIPRVRCLQQERLGKFSVSPDNKTVAFIGLSGSIHLFSATAYDYIASLKMNGSVYSTCFSSSGNYLYSFGEDGEVYVWDVNRRICTHKFFDDGCIRGTSLAVSQDDKYLACGSNTGVVNLYELDSALNTDRPKPLKSMMNLTTSVNCIRFNGTGETMASSSDLKDNAVRMFHLRSRTTFSNFPNERDRLKKIQCFDYSPNSAYFCCGNDRGQAYLYRMFHYESF